MLAWLIALVLTLANPGHAVPQPLDSVGGPPGLQSSSPLAAPVAQPRPVKANDSVGGPPGQ